MSDSESDYESDNEPRNDPLDDEEVVDDDETVDERKYDCSSRTPHPCYSKKIQAIATSAFVEKFGTKNGQLIEKYIYNATIKYCNDHGIVPMLTDRTFQNTYASISMDVLTAMEPIAVVAKSIASGKVEWNMDLHVDYIKDREIEEADHDDDVEEGVHVCRSCEKAGRPCSFTRSVSIQLRSGDEGSTVFVLCVTCKKMWRFNN